MCFDSSSDLIEIFYNRRSFLFHLCHGWTFRWSFYWYILLMMRTDNFIKVFRLNMLNWMETFFFTKIALFYWFLILIRIHSFRFFLTFSIKLNYSIIFCIFTFWFNSRWFKIRWNNRYRSLFSKWIHFTCLLLILCVFTMIWFLSL